METRLNKNKEGYGYRYTDLAQINKYCEDNYISYYQTTERIEQDDYIVTYLVIDGIKQEARRGVKIVDAVLQGIKNPAQEQGSATTYARRYSLLMALGLATDDDDAQSLSKPIINITEEDAKKQKVNFGKYKGKTLGELLEIDSSYINWINDNNDFLKPYTSLLVTPVDDEDIELQQELMDLIIKTDTDVEKIKETYKVKSTQDLKKEDIKKIIEHLKKKEGK